MSLCEVLQKRAVCELLLSDLVHMVEIEESSVKSCFLSFPSVVTYTVSLKVRFCTVLRNVAFCVNV